ncbi:MAG: PHP domain-containing protein, partial [Rikenellaceae bacterium]
MYSNYHTHTQRCNHATGSDESYVERAIQGGFSLLGFSDHTPWPFRGGYRSPIRMAM